MSVICVRERQALTRLACAARPPSTCVVPVERLVRRSVLRGSRSDGKTLSMKGVTRSRRLRWSPSETVALSVVLINFVFYLKTLAPTVHYYEPTKYPDSVVLQIQAILLGIPHTTGYPTWVMLTHLFTYLPVGDLAYRVNLGFDPLPRTDQS
jgi:Protein O-mannosyl-transferase TMEM260-like